MRVAADASLGAAVRQAQQRALPGHPHRERGALAEVDLRVVADAAFRRAEHARVLDAVAGEDAPGPVVELNGDADDKRPLGIAQPLRHCVTDRRVWKRLLELRDCLAVERGFPLQVPRIVRNVLHFGHRAAV